MSLSSSASVGTSTSGARQARALGPCARRSLTSARPLVITAAAARPEEPSDAIGTVSVPRRAALAAAVLAALSATTTTKTASAAGFKKELKKRKIPLEEYTVSPVDGLRYYDVEIGRSSANPVQKGDSAVVHFDCVYRGIDAVSSRYARTLGGNRTVAEPFSFTAGFPLPTLSERMSSSGSGGGGLFAGGTGPQPPAALTTAVLGMRPGGRRTVYVDVPELGYPKGNQEIPAGGEFELKIELLSVVPGK